MSPLPVEEKLREWTLRCGGTGSAHLSVSPASMRVEIDSAGDAGYDIQLNRPHFDVKAGESYAVEFRARAERPRTISVGVAEAHQPWNGLGLYRSVEVTAEWSEFRAEFKASATDENARIHFDLGITAETVEIGSVKLLHLPDGRVIEPSPPWIRAAVLTASDRVIGGSLRRVTPVSTNWGLDRGLPVDRYYIRKFLARHADAIAGRVLEIGDNSYTREFGGNKVTQSDVLHVSEGSPGATIIGDLTDAPQIPSDSFDCAVLTQTFQLIYDVRSAIATIHRVLKPGGVLLTTFPGISQTYDQDWSSHWYWRFSSASARRLFNDAFSPGTVTVEAFGNTLAAVSFLHGLAAEEVTAAELDRYEAGFDVTIAVRAQKARS